MASKPTTPKSTTPGPRKAAARAAAKTMVDNTGAKPGPKPGATARGAKAAANPARGRASAATGAEPNGAAPATANPAKRDLGLRLKALVDGVTETSGAKKKDVKTIVEAALAQIGAALARGETVNLPGLGHLRVARKGTAESPSMTLKLRQGEGGKGKGSKTADTPADTLDKVALAEDSDQG